MKPHLRGYHRLDLAHEAVASPESSEISQSFSEPEAKLMMNYFDSVEFLYALGNEMRGAKLGLEPMQTVLDALGNPQRHGRIVHVAGTNGKGSTSAMIASGLKARGLRTGLFTSPHLHQPTERIRIDGKPVSSAEFAAAFDVVHRAADRLIDAGILAVHPSYFEMVTLMAFHIFRDAGVDAAVYEVGLGGRLDATNVVMPELTVITPVDYDHEQFLGASIELIAGEKAGILKATRPVVIAEQQDAALAVIERRARELECPIQRTSELRPSNVAMHELGCRYELGSLAVECPLAGEHQLRNSLTAVLALRQMGVGDADIASGISCVRWPGRLEQVCDSPRIILDGAHNPAGARALASYIRRFFSGKRVGLIFGAMRDKSIDEIVTTLFSLADQLILTAPDMPRALRPEAMLDFTASKDVLIRRRLPEAIEAIEGVDVTFITGSLYLVGEARSLLLQ